MLVLESLRKGSGALPVSCLGPLNMICRGLVLVPDLGLLSKKYGHNEARYCLLKVCETLREFSKV